MGFGIGEKRKSLEEVAQIHGLTRERIRQITEKSLRKLRHPSRSAIPSTFLNLKLMNYSSQDFEKYIGHLL